MKVIGLKRVQGTFNDRPYDNYNLYCLPDVNDGVIFGYTPVCVKVKAHILHEACPETSVQSLNNRNVDFYYDSYKNVAKVLIS